MQFQGYIGSVDMKLSDLFLEHLKSLLSLRNG